MVYAQLFINSISSNLLHSKDGVVVFCLVSVNGTPLLFLFCVQYKALLN